MPYNIYAVPKAQYFNNEIVYRPYTYVGPPITKPFLDKMNTIVKQIKNNADNIVNSSQDLIYQFKNNILVNIYDEHIKYQIIKMVNMSIYLKLLKDEFTEIYHKTVELNEYLDTLVNTPVRNEFLYLIHNILSGQFDKLNSHIDKPAILTTFLGSKNKCSFQLMTPT